MHTIRAWSPYSSLDHESLTNGKQDGVNVALLTVYRAPLDVNMYAQGWSDHGLTLDNIWDSLS